MTGPGTNTYLIGRRRLVVLDPGPASESHLAALLAAIDGATVIAVAVTHTHRDHSPLATPLAARVGAPRVGRRARHPDWQDPSFVPDVVAGDDFVLESDAGALRALTTPGHASNHLCWHQPADDLVYTGDHVLGTVSPVILPPDGDMTEYLQSLARLAALAPARLAPGHGPLLREPARVIAGLTAHRLAREAAVVEALERLGPAPLATLLPSVYRDVDPSLHDMARHSLAAHLIRLERDGRARRDGDRWQRA
ncbi:MAG: MBL fold metallo-hydrolase [Proteobacteria bacterium]|nr:MBL fold metallo-hydrolase [Pseudomonadota bacterium]